ncbi:MAG: enoyl-CoA hydratase/isomerase family protein [Hyphomicrobiaceae bacterium]
MDETVLATRPSASVLLVTLNRPGKLNALTADMLDRLLALVADAERDPVTRAMVLTGAGRAFSAGADIGALESMAPERFRALVERFMALALAIQAATKPVIAAVHGYAMAGGFELAVMADVRIAASGTRFGLPDTAIGLSPTSGMTWSLPRLIGWGRAVDLTLSGRIIDDTEAERIGLVTQVVPAERLVGAALDYAEKLASAPATGVAMTKRLYAESTVGDLEAATRRELEAEMACFGEAETKERFRRFLARKRS